MADSAVPPPAAPPWHRLAIPASVTFAGIFCGVLCIVWAPTHAYWACNAIIAASLCDMIDGRLARLVGASSDFGKQLDSLADIVSFGVAPALLAYNWGQGWGLGGGDAAGAVTWGLAPVLVFVAASAFRLARFNVTADSAKPVLENTGTPMPVAALLVVTAIMTAHELGWAWLRAGSALVPLLLVVAALMVSTIPFPAYKRFKSRGRQALFFGAIAAGVTTLLLGGPGGTVLFGLLLLYVVVGVVRWIGGRLTGSGVS
jgi:CDP-diacylglycerol--serine O-phosphatidyltransferase